MTISFIPLAGAALLAGFVLCAPVRASDDAHRQDLLNTIKALSATTAVDGTGLADYESFFAEDFRRWTLGAEKTNNRAGWIAAVKQWYDEGWRVSARNSQLIELEFRGPYAFMNRIVEETYLGPKGEESVSKTGLAEVWVKSEDHWQLLRVSISVLGSE